MSCLQSSTFDLLTANPAADIAAPAWFAVQTRPRHEKKVSAELQEKGVNAFLPLVSSTRQWSDRSRVVEMPLFPQYVFVRIAQTLHTRVSVLRMRSTETRVCKVCAMRTKTYCGNKGISTTRLRSLHCRVEETSGRKALTPFSCSSAETFFSWRGRVCTANQAGAAMSAAGLAVSRSKVEDCRQLIDRAPLLSVTSDGNQLTNGDCPHLPSP